MRLLLIIIGFIFFVACGNTAGAGKQSLPEDSVAELYENDYDAVENIDTVFGLSKEEGRAMDASVSTRVRDSGALLRDDTVKLKNGVRLIRIFASGPMNEMAWWVDKSDRPLIVYSRASECNAQVLSFFYDSNGKLSQVKEDILDLADDLISAVDKDFENNDEPDSLFSVIHNRNRHKSIGKGKYGEYQFRYDKSGKLLSISKTIAIPKEHSSTSLTDISASAGHHIIGDFRPGERFWMSDLHGGIMYMYCQEEADNSDTLTGKGGSLRRWINLELVTDEEKWEEELGSPIDYNNPPVMDEEFNFYPKVIPF